MDARVSHVRDHAARVASLGIIGVSVTRLVVHHRWKEENGEETECQDHGVNNVHIGDNTKAEQGQRVRVCRLKAEVALGLIALLLFLDDLLATYLYSALRTVLLAFE